MTLQQKIIFHSEIAEVQISYSHKIKPSEQIAISSSNDAYKHILPLWKNIEYNESFGVLLLSRAQKGLGFFWLSSGGISGTVADTRMIFQSALKANASALILVHNHPSGHLFPSDADKRLTKKIKDGGDLLDISVVDHMIITSENYFSFADDGIL